MYVLSMYVPSIILFICGRAQKFSPTTSASSATRRQGPLAATAVEVLHRLRFRECVDKKTFEVVNGFGVLREVY